MARRIERDWRWPEHLGTMADVRQLDNSKQSRTWLSSRQEVRMRCLVVLFLLATVFWGCALDAQWLFRRGDANDDGTLNISDPVYLLSYLFVGGGPPPPPFADCGEDPTPDGLDCAGPLATCPQIMLSRLFSGELRCLAREEPYSVAVGDLDGDGDLDVVLAQQGYMEGRAGVYLGNGDGTFVTGAGYEVGHDPISVTTGDVDGDGDLDVLSVGTGGGVTVLWALGDGTLEVAGSYGVGRRPKAVALGDLHGDGDLDAVTANSLDSDVSVLLNRLVP